MVKLGLRGWITRPGPSRCIASVVAGVTLVAGSGPGVAGANASSVGASSPVSRQTFTREIRPHPMMPRAPLADPCVAAVPNVPASQTAVIQACLDTSANVALRPGTYVIDGPGLHMSRDGASFPSQNPGQLARLLAAPGLAHPLLEVAGGTGDSIDHLVFDGNRDQRAVATCKGYRIFGTNVAIERSPSFKFTNNQSVNTMCGSALQIVSAAPGGPGFEVTGNLFANNGRGILDKDGPEPWADGITLVSCNGGKIEGNMLINNTDIGIVDGGGEGCLITHNDISNPERKGHGFGGIALHNFHVGGGMGDHQGTMVEG